MRYILKNKENRQRKKGGCFLCDALGADNDRKNYLLFRGRHSWVVMNIFPYNNGHLLVVPNSHVPDFNGLSSEEQVDLMKFTQASVNIIKEAMEPQGFNVGINIEAAAGAGLPEHMHIQIVPRWTGDSSYISVFHDTRVFPEMLDETYERLKPYFEKLRSQETGVRSQE